MSYTPLPVTITNIPSLASLFYGRKFGLTAEQKTEVALLIPRWRREHYQQFPNSSKDDLYDFYDKKAAEYAATK